MDSRPGAWFCMDAALLACGKPLQNIAYMQGLWLTSSGSGLGLGDASAGLGLHHQDFLPKSLSTHEALFLEGIGGIKRGSFLRILAPLYKML